mmetsp:Transcript_131574/g.262555  ORF Transcript_131574/g.262555 Transcript_131574/m.262555 type:complete len:507 (-) Transcript_131574:16-1536(-)
MKPSLRPRLLGHLRDLLDEYERDIAALRQRLRASEECSGGGLGRLERLEAQLGRPGVAAVALNSRSTPPGVDERLDALEQLVMGHNGASATPPELEGRVATLERSARGLASTAANGNGSTEATQRLVEQLREQLAVSDAGRAALAGESEHWQLQSRTLRRESSLLRERLVVSENECSELRERTASAARDLAPAQAAKREADILRARVTESVAQASLLGSQLAARESDVARLERCLVDFDGAKSGGGAFSSREESGLNSLGGSRRHDTSSAAEALAAVFRGPRSLEETRLCQRLDMSHHHLPQEPTVVRVESRLGQVNGSEPLASSSQSQRQQRDTSSARSAPQPVAPVLTPAEARRPLRGVAGGCGTWTPPPMRAEPMIPNPQVLTASNSCYEFAGTAQPVARLSNASSSVDFLKLQQRDPSPHSRHMQLASPVQVQPRSQSVPVQVRRASAPPPATGGNTSVPLARWAVSPVIGPDSSRGNGPACNALVGGTSANMYSQLGMRRE